MKKDKITETIVSVVSGVGAGIIFLVLLFLVKWNFFIDTALSLGVFAALTFLLKPREKIGRIYVEGLPDGEELKKCLEDAREDYRAIETSKGKIRDPEVKTEVEKLNQTAEKIIVFLEEHPEKIKLARQFINYYQDTASSLLQKYVKLQDTDLTTDEVQNLKAETAEAVKTLNTVFEGQFQKLLHNEMMDMDAEIRLLQQTAKMENYDI
ncbi:MAG: 5-bromo-4-chloroindolyl phosphate hydrolysis family protein [Suilimivivens sp.]